MNILYKEINSILGFGDHSVNSVTIQLCSYRPNVMTDNT